jgi:predicted HTH domain antitoxin
MSVIELDIPDDSVAALASTTETVGETVRLAAAVAFFESGRLSSGAAAHFAGISKPEFLMRIKDFGVSTCQLTVESLENEVRFA